MMKTTATAISLGSVSPSDLTLIHAWRNDAELSALMTASPAPTTMEQTEQWFESTQKDQNQVMRGIFQGTDEPKRLIGLVRFMYIDWHSRVCEFGIYIGPAELRGAGYGSQAMRQALDYVFGDLKMHKVWLRVATTNEPAIKLYKSLGFQQEGVLSRHFLSGGTWQDLAVMALFNLNPRQ